eukprot:9056-Heterococcus_DN1.PRE.1
MYEVDEGAEQNPGKEFSGVASSEGEDLIICEECEDRAAAWTCTACGDGAFCDVCYHTLHRKGKRAQHKPVRMAQAVIEPEDTTTAHSTAASSFTGTICGLLGITDQYGDGADDSAMA